VGGLFVMWPSSCVWARRDCLFPVSEPCLRVADCHVVLYSCVVWVVYTTRGCRVDFSALCLT